MTHPCSRNAEPRNLWLAFIPFRVFLLSETLKLRWYTIGMDGDDDGEVSIAIANQSEIIDTFSDKYKEKIAS